jgi:GNAT superfamily N-acetyltransferase
MKDDLLSVHIDARSELLAQPFYSPEQFWSRFENYVQAPGFVLVAASPDGRLTGYAFGSPLPANTRWWDGLDGTDDPDFTRETGNRTFAFREIVVRRSYQRQGIGHQLHDALLADRPEQRATLLVRADNPARTLYVRWGWQQVGHIQPYEHSPRFEAMTLNLAAFRAKVLPNTPS